MKLALVVILLSLSSCALDIPPVISAEAVVSCLEQGEDMMDFYYRYMEEIELYEEELFDYIDGYEQCVKRVKKVKLAEEVEACLDKGLDWIASKDDMDLVFEYYACAERKDNVLL